MIQRVTCGADRISRLTNSQIDYIIEQVDLKITTNHVNKIFKIMVTASTHDSDNNFNDILDITDYFKKEEGMNKPLEKARIEKEREVILAKVNDYIMYFDEKKRESNEIKLDDKNGFGDSEEEILGELDNNDGYDEYDRYNEYDECNKDYYYHNERYKRKILPMISPIISLVTI
ncbi:hypothetical protein C1645_813669 [Glomus cerebriforme]|uniref:Uncharacterized protein n=1 Tax=Glomus cerebriforme TaxID=658196 RepID=A0A397THT3_9GLOM|nr:hypothetical protein C1645_813669 [Glomus cerebriforme]